MGIFRPVFMAGRPFDATLLLLPKSSMVERPYFPALWESMLIRWSLIACTVKKASKVR